MGLTLGAGLMCQLLTTMLLAGLDVCFLHRSIPWHFLKDHALIEGAASFDISLGLIQHLLLLHLTNVRSDLWDLDYSVRYDRGHDGTVHSLGLEKTAITMAIIPGIHSRDGFDSIIHSNFPL
jgi:hypothetical protein